MNYHKTHIEERCEKVFSLQKFNALSRQILAAFYDLPCSDVPEEKQPTGKTFAEKKTTKLDLAKVLRKRHR